MCCACMCCLRPDRCKLFNIDVLCARAQGHDESAEDRNVGHGALQQYYAHVRPLAKNPGTTPFYKKSVVLYVTVHF